jgi:hypothetical protein
MNLVLILTTIFIILNEITTDIILSVVIFPVTDNTEIKGMEQPPPPQSEGIYIYLRSGEVGGVHMMPPQAVAFYFFLVGSGTRWLGFEPETSHNPIRVFRSTN